MKTNEEWGGVRERFSKNWLGTGLGGVGTAMGNEAEEGFPQWFMKSSVSIPVMQTGSHWAGIGS
jgi:hypothetical protein